MVWNQAERAPKPVTHSRTGVWRGARPRPAGGARAVRGPPRSQARAHAHHADPAAGSEGRGSGKLKINCKNWYSISRTVLDNHAHCGNADDCSVRAFAVKPRAFDAPLCGLGLDRSARPSKG